MGKKSRKLIYIFIGIIICLLGIGVGIKLKNSSYEENFFYVDSNIEKGLKALNLPVIKKEIKKRGFLLRYKKAEEVLKIPLDYPLDKLPSRIDKELSGNRIKVYKIKENNLKDEYQILVNVGFKGKNTHKLKFILKKAKIALIIDDFGYSQGGNVDSFLKDINTPLTISIIPGTPYADLIARKAHEKGKEVMVHLPMQPKGKFKNNYKWIVLEKMEDKEIEDIVNKAIEDVPYAVGLNNHMGSLITTQKKPMEAVLKTVKRKKLYFLDSRTDTGSIALTLAKEMRVKSTKREVFLDNEKNKNYIKKQLEELISIAERKGEATGTAHIDPVTAQAIKESLSKLNNKKIQLVYASEIVN
ncbi:MAG: divergent polysaccharide deacetylase family protein [Candidatus Aerophobetes bacterium]|nr:divergent polysaccharide deacetylase family protein [Candidatus Aerophobetes bacterium]